MCLQNSSYVPRLRQGFAIYHPRIGRLDNGRWLKNVSFRECDVRCFNAAILICDAGRQTGHGTQDGVGPLRIRFGDFCLGTHTSIPRR